MPFSSVNQFANVANIIPRKKRRKRHAKKIVSGKRRVRAGKGARGKVWVPVLTQEKLSERHQYWNKFKMTKEDALFREMSENFTKLDLKRQNIDNPVFHSNSVRQYTTKPLVMPYPSGSCHTIVAGESSTFCSKLRLYQK